MRISALMCLVFLCGTPCLAQSQQPLYPRHIESPRFPPIARAAHVTGKVSLNVTIDADGHVIKAEGTSGPRLLRDAAAENLRLWTFANPPSAPYTETISYDYEFDDSLPAEDYKHVSMITRATFDLPDRVSVMTNLSVIEP